MGKYIIFSMENRVKLFLHPVDLGYVLKESFIGTVVWHSLDEVEKALRDISKIQPDITYEFELLQITQ